MTWQLLSLLDRIFLITLPDASKIAQDKNLIIVFHLNDFGKNISIIIIALLLKMLNTRPIK